MRQPVYVCFTNIDFHGIVSRNDAPRALCEPQVVNTSRIEALRHTSELVLRDCALSNGAIVAANSDRSDYLSNVEDYRRSWPRDGACQLVAAWMLEMPDAADIRTRYLRWLNERAEGFAGTGVLVKRYATNGSKDWRYGSEHQPDQAGAMLWALTETGDYPDKLTSSTIRLLANGLSSQWAGRTFNTPTQDLWENRLTNPESGDVFTYSLAAAAFGLGRAIEHWRGKTGEVDRWGETMASMYAVLESDTKGTHYLRKILGATATADPDNTLDASLDGLIYPFVVPDGVRPRAIETVLAIGRQLCILPDGVARYVGDTYDGIVRPDGGEAVAGRWPLLTFRHATAVHEIGQVEEALELYDEQIGCLDERYHDGSLPNNLIPEQLFRDDRRGIVPLGWAHAEFVFATRKLGIL